jgi:hypothetical protein
VEYADKHAGGVGSNPEVCRFLVPAQVGGPAGDRTPGPAVADPQRDGPGSSPGTGRIESGVILVFCTGRDPKIVCGGIKHAR